MYEVKYLVTRRKMCIRDRYETTLSEPRFIDHGEVTANVFAPDSRILEINSKSGFCLLYTSLQRYVSNNGIYKVKQVIVNR